MTVFIEKMIITKCKNKTETTNILEAQLRGSAAIQYNYSKPAMDVECNYVRDARLDS